MNSDVNLARPVTEGRARALRRVERLAWGLGLALLAVYGAARIHGTWMKQRELRLFDDARQAIKAVATVEPSSESTAELDANTSVDFSLWSDARVEAFQQSREAVANAPLAILRIPRIGLEVPVLDGTDELTLNRAVGRIEGTARPGEAGNLGIAGHRDGYFRGLKDVVPGDLIELETLQGSQAYVIAATKIVDPDAVDVLDPTPDASITLITCYPFYHVGPAPRRFVVHARRAPAEQNPEFSK